MASSVGYAYAILRGRVTGDKQEAENYLKNMNPNRRYLSNLYEARIRGRLKRRKYKLGYVTKRRVV